MQIIFLDISEPTIFRLPVYYVHVQQSEWIGLFNVTS